MRAVQAGVLGLAAQLILLGALADWVGLTGVGWVVGTACGLVTNGAVVCGLARDGLDMPRPADWVTLLRATLVGGVATLIAQSADRPATVRTLVALAVAALILDKVDGWVARRTEASSSFGARFDMEVDAFLILVLSCYIARSTGVWVLTIGLARYAFVAAARLQPWLRQPAPPRYWCKVVAACQGVVLTVAAADVMPRPLTDAALLGSLALLTESFGREALWLWRHRRPAPEPVSRIGPATPRPTRVRIA
jgi:phosphatidylglycerophosphate synthase